MQPSKHGDLQQAITGSKLSIAPVAELEQVLRTIFVKIGLRAANLPNPEETAVLIAHIYENFSGHTTKEIRLAFDMAINGRLDVEVNCYENFSCLYFSSIMTAYRKYAAEQVKQIKPKELKPAEVMITDFEKKQDIQEWKFKKDVRLELIPTYIYDYMAEFKEIQLTNEEKQEYIRRASNIRKTELYTEVERGGQGEKLVFNQFVNMMESGFTGLEKERVKNLAKKLAVWDYLKAQNEKV